MFSPRSGSLTLFLNQVKSSLPEDAPPLEVLSTMQTSVVDQAQRRVKVTIPHPTPVEHTYAREFNRSFCRHRQDEWLDACPLPEGIQKAVESLPRPASNPPRFRAIQTAVKFAKGLRGLTKLTGGPLPLPAGGSPVAGNRLSAAES